MRKFSNKKIAAVAAGAVILTGTGVAYAYWTTTGSGSGSATAASGVTSTLTILGPGTTGGPAALSGLLPVAQSDDATGYTPVSVMVKNTGNERQALTGITATFDVTPASGKTCGVANFEWIPVTNGDTAVAGGQTSAEVLVGKIALVNSSDNQDGCKSATVNFTFSASAAS